MSYISEELKMFVRRVDYKIEVESLSNGFNEMKVQNNERYDDMVQNISSIKEENYVFKTEYVSKDIFDKRLK